MPTDSILLTMKHYRGFGGHDIVINNLCNGLQKLGYQIVIGAFQFSEAPPDEIRYTKINRFETLALEKINGNNFDLIHNHQTLLNYYSLFSSRPFIFHYHGTASIAQEINLKLSLFLCRRKIGKTISVSRSGLAKLKSVTQTQISTDVIYNGIDTNTFNTNLPQLSKEGDPQLLFVGVLYPKKNVSALIRMMPHIIKIYPNAHLQIIGTGEEHSTLQSEIEEIGMEGRIRLVGRIAYRELPNWYSSCDVYISASLAEALPLPPFEAMSCGKPLLLSNISPHEEIVEASKAGLTFELGSIQDVISKLQLVLDKKIHYGSNAREFALKHDWEKICLQISDVYQYALNNVKDERN